MGIEPICFSYELFFVWFQLSNKEVFLKVALIIQKRTIRFYWMSHKIHF
jgi:hypothetical protein